MKTPKNNKSLPKFYRIKSGKKLFSFGDDIGEVPVLGKPLCHFQQAVIEKCGGLLMDVKDQKDIQDQAYFCFDDDLFFTESFTKAVIALALQERKSFRICLTPNSFNERYILPHTKEAESQLQFNFFYFNSNSGGYTNQVIDQKVFQHPVYLPHQIVKSGNYACDQCDTFISRVASPFHLLQVNMALNFSRLIKLRKNIPQWIVDKFAPNFSRIRNNRLRSLNRRGKNCSVHPKAILENAILGDNVTIGANAIIRNSFIGDDTAISDNVSILNCVLGKRNVICNGNLINLCLTYDDVFLIHGPYQFSVFGNSTAVFAVINCDIRLDQKNISIPTDIGVLDSNQPLLGIAYGHFSKVGGGNIIASGRIVPNNRIVNPPDTIILKFD